MKVNIGDWYTYCCQIDLDRIIDEETRKDIQDIFNEGNEEGIHIWKTEEELKDFYKYDSDFEDVLKKIEKMKKIPLRLNSHAE